ncbi:RhoGEF domain protein [Dictyocaulus viviparus]|uniref:RhoGEF domain protein n=1 Tax=Dictyocaulus viviparus TaxID=29172 RepID=A0A0D8YBN8_DICVI|nr:RhoGEF domain protein [Dictyocaulus viviparus]
MPPTSLTSSRLSEDDPARLSFISSSTGYSSARSSLRSSDGGEDHNSRDSGIVSNSSLSSLSSSRRSTLLSSGSLSQIDRIAIELFDTEKSYVDDLYAVIQGYLNFLVDHRDELGVTLDDVSSLFGCIERIYAFNRKLLQQLDLADLDCVKMSRCFVDNAGKFEDYIAYCTNYHRMITTLTQLQQLPQMAAALAQRQTALGHALPLSAYLLKPVQRVLKYHLFIENMLKHLPSSLSADDYGVVKRAHEVMTSQAARINDEKKRAEHAERVEQLQTAIQKWSVDKQTANLLSYGDLLLEASFRQAGSKTTRLLFLFEEMLLIVKQRNSNYICKDYIMASNYDSSNLMLNESIYPEEPLAFQVLSFDNPRAQYIFLASSSDQKRLWMIELKRMMLDHYGIEIPEKTKQLMLSMDNTHRVSFGRPEFAEVSLKNHKRVPKYLEKRRKSVDKVGVEQSRRRSLSASRLLGASKTSLVSDSARHKLFGAMDLMPKCSCHMASSPGPSGDLLPARVSAVSKAPVPRTLSASTIMFNNGSEAASPAPEAVLSSRNRYHMARNKRIFSSKGEIRSPTIRRIHCEEIDETFDELFRELVSCGDSNSEMQNSSEQDAVQEVLVWKQQEANKSRSKSLTRLDDFTDNADDPQDLSESNAVSVRSESLHVSVFGPERRFSKSDQVKRLRSKKYNIGEYSELRTNISRMLFSDRTPTIPEVSSPRGDIPLIDDDVLSPRQLAARQRTPLTVEQAAQLDSMIPATNGVIFRIDLNDMRN